MKSNSSYFVVKTVGGRWVLPLPSNIFAPRANSRSGRSSKASVISNPIYGTFEKARRFDSLSNALEVAKLHGAFVQQIRVKSEIVTG